MEFNTKFTDEYNKWMESEKTRTLNKIKTIRLPFSGPSASGGYDLKYSGKDNISVMGRLLNKYYIAVIVIIVFLAIGYHEYQSPDIPKSVDKKISQIMTNEILSTALDGGETELLVFLSFKYDLDYEIIKKITHEFSPEAYANKFNELIKLKSYEKFEQYRKKGIKNRTQDVIVDLSNNLKIDKKTIASIIIDYKALNNVGFKQETDEGVDNSLSETNHDAGRF